MDRARWLRFGVIAVAALSVVGLLVGSLQAVRTDDSPATPKECERASDSQECREALVGQKIESQDAAALRDVDEATRLKVARALCKEGVAISESGEARPLRSETYARVAEAQGVKPEAVAAIVAGLSPLCRSSAEQLEGLPSTSGPVSVRYEAFGSGPVTIRYTEPGGSSVDEDGFVPWLLPVTIQSARSLSLSVDPRTVDVDGVKPASKLGCSISVGTVVVARAEAKSKGGGVKCTAKEEDVTTAANSTPTTAAPAAGP